MIPQPQLFHRIDDPGSATARRVLVELHLEERVRLRNLTYPEVQEDFARFGGVDAPAFCDSDGSNLVSGADAVVAALRALALAQTPA